MMTFSFLIPNSLDSFKNCFWEAAEGVGTPGTGCQEEPEKECLSCNAAQRPAGKGRLLAAAGMAGGRPARAWESTRALPTRCLPLRPPPSPFLPQRSQSRLRAGGSGAQGRRKLGAAQGQRQGSPLSGPPGSALSVEAGFWAHKSALQQRAHLSSAAPCDRPAACGRRPRDGERSAMATQQAVRSPFIHSFMSGRRI